MKEDPDWLEMRALATRQVEAGEEDALEKFAQSHVGLCAIIADVHSLAGSK